MPNKKKGHPHEGSPKDQFARDHRPPAVSGQCAEVMELIRSHVSIMSLVMTADYAIPEAAARVHDLRTMGYNIITTILPEVEFRGAFAAASRCTRWACRRGLLRAGLEVAA